MDGPAGLVPIACVGAPPTFTRAAAVSAGALLLAQPVDANPEALRGIVILPEEAHLVVERLAELDGRGGRIVPVALEGQPLRPVRREIELGGEHHQRWITPILAVGDAPGGVSRPRAVPDLHLGA